MRDEVGSPWDFGPIRPLTYRGDGASQITKGRGVNGAPTPFRSHGAHRKRGGYETVTEAYHCSGGIAQGFRAVALHQTIAQLASRGADLK